MNAGQQKEIIALLKSFPQIKLCYFFGSRARNEAGPMSDYDFAIYIDGLSHKDRFQLKMSVLSKMYEIFETDAVDLVILDAEIPTGLAYNIIFEGRLIYEIEPFKLLIEPRILNEYFDFKIGLQRNNLTRVK